MASLKDNRIQSLGQKNHEFTNWASTYGCTPQLYFEPETEEDIRQILNCAQEEGKSVKVIGNGHSPSDLACTSDFLISLRKLDRLVKVDKEHKQVMVEAGCLLCDMNKILPEHGLAFSVLGTVSEVTAGGVISTGTHGTGAKYGTLASYVVSVDLMTASGEVVTVSKKENADLFPAVCVSLGSLGVILRVTFQCESTFRLHQRQFPNTLKQVIENLDVYVEASDHFRFVWYPHTESVVCYNASRTDKPPKDVPHSWFWTKLVGFHLLHLVLYLSTFFPRLVPAISRWHFYLFGSHVEDMVSAGPSIFNFDCLFQQYVMEWAIPRNNTGVVLFELYEWVEKSGFPAHFPVEVRFTKADDIFLSMCYQQDSCFINILMFRPYNKCVAHEVYWKKFEEIVSRHGGRPHWAKDHTYSMEHFKKLYPKFEEFCSIRKRLDPTGVFLNPNLERIFGIGQSGSVANIFRR